MTHTLFTQLHQQSTPLLMANVWDVPSALSAKKVGFQAIGTSSAAIANMLGYHDGEDMSFEELFFIVKRISACTDIPLSVDIEAGYSNDPQVVVSQLVQLAKCGVVGINIEDSNVQGVRSLKDAHEFASMLSHIKKQLDKQRIQLFINVRIDTYICGASNRLNETIRRATLYQSHGADGIFVPCITDTHEISQLVHTVTLPVNVMCMPELDDFDSLSDVGVSRISMGNFLFDKGCDNTQALLHSIRQNRSFASLF